MSAHLREFVFQLGNQPPSVTTDQPILSRRARIIPPSSKRRCRRHVEGLHALETGEPLHLP
jgi:hypothetical protein